jgi:hypothetical protein
VRAGQFNHCRHLQGPKQYFNVGVPCHQRLAMMRARRQSGWFRPASQFAEWSPIVLHR